jgi:glucan endo-1,3-beta-D-glucosidase
MRTSTLLTGLATLSHSLAYKGFNYGALDLSGAVKTQSDYETEFNAAKSLPGTNGEYTSARLYTSLQGSTGQPIEAIAAAIATQTSLLLGIWISGSPDVSAEINALLAAASQHGSAFTDLVAGISVGNEDVYRVTPLGVASNAGPGVFPQDVANYVNQVRSGLAGSALAGKPVGHVDTYNTFANASDWMAPVIEAVDFIGMNGFPYFENTKPNSIGNGNATFWADYDAVVANAQGKEIWITETGWPSVGPVSGEAVASVENAETYYSEVACSIFARGLNVWWYTLQDSTSNGNVPSFGVAQDDASFTPKYDLSC